MFPWGRRKRRATKVRTVAEYTNIISSLALIARNRTEKQGDAVPATNFIDNYEKRISALQPSPLGASREAARARRVQIELRLQRVVTAAEAEGISRRMVPDDFVDTGSGYEIAQETQSVRLRGFTSSIRIGLGLPPRSRIRSMQNDLKPQGGIVTRTSPRDLMSIAESSAATWPVCAFYDLDAQGTLRGFSAIHAGREGRGWRQALPVTRLVFPRARQGMEPMNWDKRADLIGKIRRATINQAGLRGATLGSAFDRQVELIETRSSGRVKFTIRRPPGGAARVLPEVVMYGLWLERMGLIQVATQVPVRLSPKTVVDLERSFASRSGSWVPDAAEATARVGRYGFGSAADVVVFNPVVRGHALVVRFPHQGEEDG